MNYRMIARILGMVLLILAALLVLPLIAGLCYGENVLNFAVTIAAAAALGGIFMLFKPKNRDIYAREGFTAVGLSWILMSLIGALPFVISGDIPSYVDALFETVSGFTTTGSTLLTDIEAMSRGCMFWRMFTHWIGGMGVLVFIMAVLPMSGEHSMHIMRAEIPGPVVGKLVPRARKTAAILYIIYMGLTAIETVFLLCGGMSFYDAMLHAFATAGTGGFSTRGAGIAAFDSLYIEVVISVFMLLFGVNFSIYFLLIIFFSYFYSTIQFNPIEVANNLKKNGGFIPGYRPGKPTSEFIQKVLNKVTLFGAVYLGIIACGPIIISACSKAAADTGISLGGTSIIIVVGVAIETVQALESQMLMRHYKGFLE